jgi:hypothetical protein
MELQEWHGGERLLQIHWFSCWHKKVSWERKSDNRSTKEEALYLKAESVLIELLYREQKNRPDSSSPIFFNVKLNCIVGLVK